MGGFNNTNPMSFEDIEETVESSTPVVEKATEEVEKEEE